MVFKKVEFDVLKESEKMIVPVYARYGLTSPVPKWTLPEKSMLPRSAYRLVHDELMLDGNSEFNLATFVTTWMEPEAQKIRVLTSGTKCSSK